MRIFINIYIDYYLLINSVIFATKYLKRMNKSNRLKNIETKFKRIVIKVGSNVITKNDGSINGWRISRLVEELYF